MSAGEKDVLSVEKLDGKLVLMMVFLLVIWKAVKMVAFSASKMDA